MKANMKLLKVCQGTVGWMTLKRNSHDMIMVSFCKKVVLISLDKSSSSQNEWNGRKLLMN